MKYPTKEEIERFYIEQGLSMKETAHCLCVSTGLIHRLIHQYGIHARPRFQGMKGKHHSDHVKEVISNAKKGKTISESTREKMRDAAKGRVLCPSQFGGHVKIIKNGYRIVYAPNHPNAHKDGYALEHVVAYGFYHNCVVDTEKYAIHHINGVKTDNRKDNLIMMTKKEHMGYHMKKRHEMRRLSCKNL